MIRQGIGQDSQQNFVERKGKIEDLDGSFDLEFWKNQTPQQRFAAAWEMIIHVSKIQGIPMRQLRLDRSVENFQQQQTRSGE